MATKDLILGEDKPKRPDAITPLPNLDSSRLTQQATTQMTATPPLPTTPPDAPTKKATFGQRLKGAFRAEAQDFKDMMTVGPESEDEANNKGFYESFTNTEERSRASRLREQRDKFLASIGDGISAIANLAFTGKGSMNLYDPSNSLSAHVGAKWDKLNKEWLADAERRARAKQQLYNANLQERRLQQQQENADREAAIKAAGVKAKDATTQSTIEANIARANYYNSKANNPTTGASPKTGKVTDKQALSRVQKRAMELGIPIKGKKTVETTNEYGQKVLKEIEYYYPQGELEGLIAEREAPKSKGAAYGQKKTTKKAY